MILLLLACIIGNVCGELTFQFPKMSANFSYGDLPLNSNSFLENYFMFNKFKSWSKLGNQEVLAYVTPWNYKGYITAKMMSSKIDWLSPVWFQIRRNESNNVIVSGTHDVDVGWLSLLKERRLNHFLNHKCPENELTESYTLYTGDSIDVCKERESNNYKQISVVPRIVLETDLKQPSSSSQIVDNKSIREIVRLLSNLILDYGFDGFVLEISLNDLDVGLELSRLLKKKLKTIKVIYVIPPVITQRKATDKLAGVFRQALSAIEPFVDRFSVMSYDYSRSVPTKAKVIKAEDTFIGNGTFADHVVKLKFDKSFFPNSPFEWFKEVYFSVQDAIANGMKDNSKNYKILMGLPLYGYKMPGNEAITGEDFINFLDRSDDLRIYYDEIAKEHIFMNDSVSSCFPTPLFLEERINWIQGVGGGVALWELGQMLPMYMDVF